MAGELVRQAAYELCCVDQNAGEMKEANRARIAESIAGSLGMAFTPAVTAGEAIVIDPTIRKIMELAILMRTHRQCP